MLGEMDDDDVEMFVSGHGEKRALSMTRAEALSLWRRLSMVLRPLEADDESLDRPEPSGEPMGLNELVASRLRPPQPTFVEFLDAIPAGMRVTFDRSDRA